MTYQSFSVEWYSFLGELISNPVRHSLWLNTLSFLENCGAKKLAAYEHPSKVKEEMLKHAAEEFRHAYYLKQQMHRLSVPFLVDYRFEFLLGGREAYLYFYRLEIVICRLLKKVYLKENDEFKALAYLLVTYAIECRAEEVYSIYHEALKREKSTIRVHSILLEEKEHLSEITAELKSWPLAESLCKEVCREEAILCQNWTRNFLN